MNAIILAAGISKRLKPLTDNTPKSLIKINEESLLERNINILYQAGIKKITIVVGYLKEKIINRINRNHFPDIDIKHIENPIYDSSGSGYSLYLGLDEGHPNEDTVFMDADILIHPGIIKGIHSDPQSSFLYVSRSDCDDEAVKVTTNKKGDLKRLSKKINSNDKCMGESVGIVKLNPDQRQIVKKTMQGFIDKKNFNFEWEEIMDNNKTLSIKPKLTDLPWIEIDFPKDLLRAADVLKQIESNNA